MGHRLVNLGCCLPLFTVISLVVCSRPWCCSPAYYLHFSSCVCRGLLTGRGDMLIRRQGISQPPTSCPWAGLGLSAHYLPYRPGHSLLSQPSNTVHNTALCSSKLSGLHCLCVVEKNVCGHVIKACLIMSLPKELNLGCICNQPHVWHFLPLE